MSHKLIHDALLIWVTIEPIGSVLLFTALTPNLTTAERRKVAIKATAFAALVLLGSIIVGQILLAAMHIKAGEWPWSFFCWPEERPRPVFPSAFRLLAPAADGEHVGLLVRCPVCGKVSVNLVSRAHVDVPFVNDREVGVVGHYFEDDAAAVIDEFRAELSSSSFDARRLGL